MIYALTYANDGNYPAENVVLSEVYDPYTVYEVASPLPTVGDNAWQIGPLPPGAAGTVMITVRVAETVTNGLWLTNTAFLSGDGLDTEVATVSTMVGQPDIRLENAALTGVRPGQFLTYTLTGQKHLFFASHWS